MLTCVTVTQDDGGAVHLEHLARLVVELLDPGGQCVRSSPLQHHLLGGALPGGCPGHNNNNNKQLPRHRVVQHCRTWINMQKACSLCISLIHLRISLQCVCGGVNKWRGKTKIRRWRVRKRLIAGFLCLRNHLPARRFESIFTRVGVIRQRKRETFGLPVNI